MASNKRKVAASREEAAKIGGQIQVLMRRGAFAEATELLREWIDRLEDRKPVSKFHGFAKLQEVPLALTDMDPLCREMLDEAGYLTIGHIEQADDDELRTIERISGRRIEKIREAVEATTRQYIEYRIQQDH